MHLRTKLVYALNPPIKIKSKAEEIMLNTLGELEKKTFLKHRAKIVPNARLKWFLSTRTQSNYLYTKKTKAYLDDCPPGLSSWIFWGKSSDNFSRHYREKLNLLTISSTMLWLCNNCSLYFKPETLFGM